VRKRISSALSLVPVTITAKEALQPATTKQRLLRVMSSLKLQYNRWLASPFLPYAGTYVLQPGSYSNPHSAVIINIGVVESHLPTDWSQSSEELTLSIDEFSIIPRQSLSTRP
jgi:hypothetical protein